MALPLNALRAFEAAARTGSFVSAGTELGVTAAAVSQQVKALEEVISKKLFLRQGNRITLTEAGRALYPRLGSMFTDLTALMRDLSDGPQRPRLVVSALSSLAELWLIPALADYPDRAGIEVRVAEDPVDFARQGVDLRVTYGPHYYPDHQVRPLFSDRYVAVARPDLATRWPVADIPDAALIHTVWGPDFVNQPEWSRWFAAAGLTRLPPDGTGLQVGQTALAIAAARAGMGVALAPARLADPEIGRGTLAGLSNVAVPLTWDYVLVHPVAFAGRPRLDRLVAHLTLRAARPLLPIPARTAVV